MSSAARKPLEIPARADSLLKTSTLLLLRSRRSHIAAILHFRENVRGRRSGYSIARSKPFWGTSRSVSMVPVGFSLLASERICYLTSLLSGSLCKEPVGMAHVVLSGAVCERLVRLRGYGTRTPTRKISACRYRHCDRFKVGLETSGRKYKCIVWGTHERSILCKSRWSKLHRLLTQGAGRRARMCVFRFGPSMGSLDRCGFLCK